MSTRKALATALAALAMLPACGGEDKPEFTDQAAFEAYVAAYVGVESVSCVKTTDVTARCVVDANSDVYFVACQTAEGEGCTIRAKANEAPTEGAEGGTS